MLVWSKNFETGIPELDAQHRELIAYVNRLEWMALNQTLNRLDVVYLNHFLEFLEEFARRHFHREEECMVKYQCPAYEECRRSHQDLIAYQDQFRLRLKTKVIQPQDVRELSNFCNLWIQNHFQKIDLQLKASLSAPERPAGEA